MKKIVFFIIAALVLLIPVLSFAQTDKEMEQAKSWLGQWKRNFASPTYGIAIFHGQLDGGWNMPQQLNDSDKEFPVTAMDLRIFKGVNVSKRGGFYTGVEAGVLFLAPFMDTTFDEPNLGEKMGLSYNGGLVFLMAKYGLRIDLGISLFGVSLGAEVGMGGTLFAGGFDFYTGPKDNPTVDEGFGSDKASMGLILDTAAEAALRLGKNFRLVGKLGVMAAPIAVSENNDRNDYIFDNVNGKVYYAWDTTQASEITPGSDEYKRAVMSQYSIHIDPFALDARVGFVLNFN